MARLAAGTPLSDTARAALEHAEVDGLTVRLHGQLDRADYEQVNAVLGRIAGGGKWNRHKGVHLFGQDPGADLELAVRAGTLPPDPKRRDGWFATPELLCDDLAYNYALSSIDPDNYRTLRILEPSAGEGALADSLCKFYGIQPDQIRCVETDPWRVAVLRRKGYPVLEGRFQDRVGDLSGLFDLVLMNPPFTEPDDKLAYVAHVELAWSLLAPGGALVAVVPNGFASRTDKRTARLRALVEEHGWSDTLPERAFEASGTGVQSMVVVLTRSEATAEERSEGDLLHHENGSHRGTAPSANGRVLEAFDQGIRPHLADGHSHEQAEPLTLFVP